MASTKPQINPKKNTTVPEHRYSKVLVISVPMLPLRHERLLNTVHQVNLPCKAEEVGLAQVMNYVGGMAMMWPILGAIQGLQPHHVQGPKTQLH
mmetsp:Transcript_5412/g.10171  ORF Transcript_5412/g.10171 Transcript_5412/m.10171 type:complete len:94 (+) Transcript_5412:176-457(+)